MGNTSRYPNYEKLMQNGLLPKVDLVLKNGTITVSRTLLSLYSDYFYDLFTKYPKEDTFEIPIIEFDYFACYINVMLKTNTCALDGSLIYKLVKVQQILNSSYLESIINDWLEYKPEIVFLPLIYNAVCNVSSQRLRNKVKSLILSHFSDIHETSVFDFICYTHLIELFDVEFLKKVSQKDILIVFTKWIVYDIQNRKSAWKELFMRLNFDNIEKNFIVNEYIFNYPKLYHISELISFLHDIVSKNAVRVYNLPGLSKVFLFGGSNANNSIVCCDLNEDSIREVAKLENPKQYHTSQKIGSSAFIFGGDQNTKVERFDVHTNICETLSLEMPSIRKCLASAVLNTKIFAIGGNIDEKISARVDYFEPKKMTWIQNGKLPKAVQFHDSVVVDGVIYVTPGEGCPNIQRFDEREGKWTLLKESKEKAATSAISLFNKNILCSGGDYNHSNLDSCRLYDIVGDSWRNIQNLPIAMRGGSSIELKDKIIHFGGVARTCKNHIYVYSKAKARWSHSKYVLPKANAYNSKIMF